MVIKMIERVPTGVQGLDDLIEGGFPKNSIVIISGEPGTGKTTFALQFIYEGVKKGEPGVFITFEEKVNEHYSNA